MDDASKVKKVTRMQRIRNFVLTEKFQRQMQAKQLDKFIVALVMRTCQFDFESAQTIADAAMLICIGTCIIQCDNFDPFYKMIQGQSMNAFKYAIAPVEW